jgi:hypothetical protein
LDKKRWKEHLTFFDCSGAKSKLHAFTVMMVTVPCFYFIHKISCTENSEREREREQGITYSLAANFRSLVMAFGYSVKFALERKLLFYVLCPDARFTFS